MMQLDPIDPILIHNLLTTAERHLANPDQKISGAAVKGLRILFALTHKLIRWMESAPPGAQLPPGLPATIGEAEALHRRAAQVVLDVLKIRQQQREAQRDAGGPIFTGADIDAIRLWIRCFRLLSAPLPELVTDRQPPSVAGIGELLAQLALGTPASPSAPKSATRTATLRNGRRVQKQVRHRPMATAAAQPVSS